MSEPREYKMWLIVRDDIEIPKGKLAVQSGHAFERLTAKIYEAGVMGNYDQYVRDNTPKIAVKAKNLAALERAEQELYEANIPTYKVTDAGRTVFSEPTITVMSCGPAYFEDLPKFVQRFQLIKE